MLRSWKEEIVEALRALGGQANLADIYAQISRQRQPLSSAWQATVRQTIERHSSDSDNFKGEDLFYSVNGLGEGDWGLRR